jgi:hypothetical protein
MTTKNIRDLRPGDIIRCCGKFETIESVSPGETGYWLITAEYPVFYRFGATVLVIDELDAVGEAERIVAEAD